VKLYKLQLNGKKALHNVYLGMERALEPLERELACFIPLSIGNVVWSQCFDGLVSPIQGDISAHVEIAVKRTYHAG
jgi:hypothetical protein